MTPHDVQKLAYVTSRSGKRVKTPLDTDPYWRELREKAKLVIPEGVGHFFTKHFDPEHGKYYYYDHISASSTWDKPAGDNIEIYRPESLVEGMFQAHTEAAKEKSKLVARRRKAYDEFQRDKAENLAELWLDREKEEAKRVQNIWNKACIEAALQHGRIELSWQKMVTIDELVFTFSENFGMPVSALKLVGIDLPELTTEVGHRLPSLERLSLANNHLTCLPDNIIMLTNLKELNLLKNKIVQLPSRIGLMIALQKLEVANNLLTSVPASFGALQLLTVVNLECNKIRVLPENLDHLVSCKYLNVNNNCLVRLPKCVARMPKLEILSASQNQIAYIPEEVFESESIRRIRLSANLIRHLPDSLGKMKRLKELCLDYNRLSVVPVSIYKLTRLRILRIEGNLLLTDPPPDIIGQGAERVVRYFHQRVMSDEAWKVRTIVTAVQDMLVQAQEREIGDESEFEPAQKAVGDDDLYFAFQMTHFFGHILPALRDVWRMEGLTGVIERKYKLAAFPYSEKEVNWGFSRFSDANGPVMKFEPAMFRKCACVDDDGRRRPCVPPAVGFMCRRMCTMVKSKNVLQADRQQRSWTEYYNHNLGDAVTRAKEEALMYLKSEEGKDWVAACAYEQAQEVLGGREENNQLVWRQRFANSQKKGIIRRYERRKWGVMKIRENRHQTMSDEIARLKGKIASDLDMQIEGGFARTVVDAKIEDLQNRLNNMEEDVQLQRLQLYCEQECDLVDDDVYEQRLKGDEVDPLASSSESESDETDSEDDKSRKSRDDSEADIETLEQRIQTRLVDRQAKRDADAAQIELDAKRVRSYRKAGMADGTLIDPPARGVVEATAKFAQYAATQTMGKDKFNKAVSHAIMKTPKGLRSAVFEALNLKKTARKVLRHVKDVVEIRSRRLIAEWSGGAVELQRELQYEYYTQYINYMTFQAKEKATADLQLIDSMRRSLGAAGLVVVFETWRDYVKTKRTRERRDAEKQYEAEVKTFATVMESVKVAQHHVSRWKRCVDVYSDKVFWQHEETGEVSLAEPGIHNYLPALFVIPKVPDKLPPWEQEEKVEEEEEEEMHAGGGAGGGAGGERPRDRTPMRTGLTPTRTPSPTRVSGVLACGSVCSKMGAGRAREMCFHRSKRSTD